MHSSLVAPLVGAMPEEQRITELDDIDTLVHTYRARLLRFVAFSTGDADLAETIVQDCFLKAYRSRASFRGDCGAYTWLVSIATNLVKDYQRTQKFRFWRKARQSSLDVSTIAGLLASGARSQEAQLIARERAAQLGAVVEMLSANQRSVFLMRFIEEMSVQQICTATGMQTATVKTHIHRAVKIVRQKMGADR